MESYWKSPDVWVCPNHFPSAKHHRLAARCSYSNCNEKRPVYFNNEPKKLCIVSVDPCAWFKCKRGVDGSHAHRRLNSKYCSLQCKNDNARYRHKMRKSKDAA
jgi:hypothetical protein